MASEAAAFMLLGTVLSLASPPEPASPPASPSTSASAAVAVPELSLDAALAELDRQNLSLVQARSRADEARAATGQAESQLLPSLSAGATYARNSASAGLSIGPLPPIFPSGKSLVIQPLEQLTAQGALRIPLVVPAAWYDVRSARSAARAADATAEAARLQLRAGLAQAAHAARAAEEVVVASEQAVELAAELARSADRRVAAGIAPPLDVLRARTEEVRRESDLARARADLGRARLALGILLGRDGPVRILVPEVVAEPAGDPEALARDALGRRPEVRAQREQVAAAEDRLRGTWALLAPQVSASGTIFASDVPYPTGDRSGWRATLDLTWPIYDGGLREARRRQARAQLASAEAGDAAERLAVVQEVADAARDLDVARERLRLAETQRALAADAAASARRSFEGGIASSLDVVDANDRLYQADIGLADARARLAQAAIALDRALGREPQR